MCRSRSTRRESLRSFRSGGNPELQNCVSRAWDSWNSGTPELSELQNCVSRAWDSWNSGTPELRTFGTAELRVPRVGQLALPGIWELRSCRNFDSFGTSGFP